eukprot:403343458
MASHHHQRNNSTSSSQELQNNLESNSSQHIAALKSTLAETLQQVQEIETQLKSRLESNGITQEARRAILDDVQNRVEAARNVINESVEKQYGKITQTLDSLIERVNELKTIKLNQDGSILNDQASGGSNQQTNLRKKLFSQKIFHERDSLLTYTNGGEQGFRTLENIFIAFLILLGVQICVDEYFENGNIFPDLQLFYWVFGKFDKVIYTLITMYLISFTSVLVIQQVKNRKLSYLIYIPIYFTIQTILFIIGIYSCYYYQLQPASALVVSAEMARCGMKVHAYFREKILNGIHRNSELSLYIPQWAAKQGIQVGDLDIPDISVGSMKTEFQRFAYFFLAPTLLYRDTYPRNRKLRMNILLKNLGTFLLLIFYLWSVFKALCIPIFKHTVSNPGSLRQFIASVIFSSVSGIICLLTLFYGILHSWFNIFGELLRFGDRLFYEDWWNVKDFAGYYRKWNIVVHEFLYYYVYQDLIRLSKGRFNRQNAKYMVFLISAVIHEIIMTCGLGFFFPVLFVLFGGPGVIFTKIHFGSHSYVGTMFWFLMLIGSGIIMVLICREFYARQHPMASKFSDGFWIYLYPQSLRFLQEYQ